MFAGVLAAGAVDLVLMLARGQEARPAEAVALTIGLHGLLGLVLGALAGWAAAMVLAPLPAPLGAYPEVDGRVATGIVAGAVGAVALALIAAAGYGVLVAPMHSKRLAIIATAGVTLLSVAPAVVAAIAVRRPAAALVRGLPALGRAGRTGLVLLTMLFLGIAGGVLALSRADWRVLDLGPLKALAIAGALGLLHGLFWHRSSRAARLLGHRSLAAFRAGLAVVVLALLPAASRVSEGSPTFAAIEEHALGSRALVSVARRLTDQDGDGHSARFGGGDCDDARVDSFPGAQEVPGDGVDQNCQGGDATAEVTSAGAGGGGGGPETPVVRRAGEAFTGNLLIISVDALRADRLGVAGYKRRKGNSLTPHLDALASRGAYFRRVWSQAPNTPRSFPAFLTGRYPSDIEWAQKTANYSALLPANETFFEQLARVGIRPIGIFSHFYFTADRGLNQGFAEWNNDGAGTIAESNKDIASPRMVPRVIARLKKAAASKERFAVWTHLFEPHSSYMSHPEFPTTSRGVDGLQEKYDYEIAFVDRWIGKLLAALDDNGLRENTAVVVLADHGEAWGEHKHYFHGQDLTEEQLRVPLIVAVPGRKPVVVQDEVAVVDVGATLLDLVGITAPASFRGRSLLAAIDGEKLPPRPLFGELLPASAWPKHEVMMVAEGKKLTHKITERRWELHDLTADPGQRQDLSRDPKHQALLRALQARVLAFEEGKR